MMAPCSVTAKGRYFRCWPRPVFKVANCDLEDAHSSAVSRNIEVRRKSHRIALDGLVEALGRHLIERGQLGIQDHPPVTQRGDAQ
jgi:hypothetical protein